MHIYYYLLYVMLFNKKKSSFTGHWFLNMAKKHHAHPFYIEYKGAYITYVGGGRGGAEGFTNFSKNIS